MSPLTVLAQASTIPDDTGGPYVVAVYLVFLVIVVIYVAIMAQRLTRLSKQADALEARLDAKAEPARSEPSDAVGAPAAESKPATEEVAS